MHFEHLHRRYGTHIAQRVRNELTASEFEQIDIDDLPRWLEARAEAAHQDYRLLLSNPLSAPETNNLQTGLACSLWRIAEDLVYLVAIADDGGSRAKVI